MSTTIPPSSVAQEPTLLHPNAGALDLDVGRVERRVGFTYGVTGLVLFGLMVLVGIALRYTQAEGPGGFTDDWFYRFMTLHGAGMIAGILLALMGGLWYVVRSSVPTLDAGRAMAAYWAMVGGVGLVLVSVVFGGFAAAWTFLYPLPFESAGQWESWATVLFIIGIALVGISFTIFCIDVLKAVTETYDGLAGALGLRWLRGRSDTPPPPAAIAGTAVAVQGIIAGAVGMTILVALANHLVDDSVTLDPLWAKNLTFFFGHTTANLTIYLGAGMLYVLVPLYAGRPWKTTKPIVYGWMGTICFVMTAYAHHLYMDFVQPGGFHVMGVIASSAAALPVAVVTIYTGMMLVWGSRYRWSLTSILFFLGFVGWTLGGVGAVMDSAIPLNFRLHNTLWVPAHFHSYMLMGTALWVMGFVSYLLERSSGRTAGPRVTKFGVGGMVVGGYGLIYAWYFSGAMGIPRRWSEHPGNSSYWSVIATAFAIIFLIAFLVIAVEFVRMALEARARRRGGGDASVVTAAPAVPTGSTVTAAFRPMVTTYWGLVAMVAVGVASLFVLYPPLVRASEASVSYHHLSHAVQYFAGAMLGAALGSTPSIIRRFPWGTNGGLTVALVTPVVMLMVMIPLIYNDLVTNDLVHVGYHLIMVVLGIITGLGAAALGRVAGWLVLLTSVGMAVLYAPGVTGG